MNKAYCFWRCSIINHMSDSYVYAKYFAKKIVMAWNSFVHCGVSDFEIEFKNSKKTDDSICVTNDKSMNGVNIAYC